MIRDADLHFVFRVRSPGRGVSNQSGFYDNDENDNGGTKLLQIRPLMEKIPHASGTYRNDLLMSCSRVIFLPTR